MSDLQREKFEAWFKRQLDSEYCSSNVKSLMFECWQAAIESVAIELPELCDGENSCKCYYESESIEKALDKAGVKYK